MSNKVASHSTLGGVAFNVIESLGSSLITRELNQCVRVYLEERSTS